MSISEDRRRAALQKLESLPALDEETRTALDAMSEAEAHGNAVNDPDAPPSNAGQLRLAREARRARQNTTEKRSLDASDQRSESVLFKLFDK